MTQQEKDLVLKDISARLPYGVKATTTSNGWNGIYTITGCVDDRIYLDCPIYDEGDDEWLAEFIKPYLRPMSSMTEEEREELKDLCSRYDNDGDASTYEYWSISVFNESRYGIYYDNNFDAIDWLNANHFDYRGLIKKGLAKEAPEWMYKTE